MKKRHSSSFVCSLFEEVQLIHFHWTFCDGHFSNKQDSYFAANPRYFRRFTLPTFLKPEVLTHKKSMTKMLSLRTSGMTALVVITYL